MKFTELLQNSVFRAGNAYAARMAIIRSDGIPHIYLKLYSNNPNNLIKAYRKGPSEDLFTEVNLYLSNADLDADDWELFGIEVIIKRKDK